MAFKVIRASCGCYMASVDVDGELVLECSICTRHMAAAGREIEARLAESGRPGEMAQYTLTLGESPEAQERACDLIDTVMIRRDPTIVAVERTRVKPLDQR